MTTSLCILLADAQPVFRLGLRTLLEAHDGWEVVGEAATGRQAVALAVQTEPDIVLLDVNLPELSGLEATRQILHSLPRSEVLILTTHQSEQTQLDALRAGARGYILKSDDQRHVLAAVEALSRHEPFFTSALLQTLLPGYLDPSLQVDPEHLVPLTPRELQVVKLLTDSKTRKQIAAALGISARTADMYRARIMRKLGLHSRPDLIRYAVRNKIVEPSRRLPE